MHHHVSFLHKLSIDLNWSSKPPTLFPFLILVAVLSPRLRKEPDGEGISRFQKNRLGKWVNRLVKWLALQKRKRTTSLWRKQVGRGRTEKPNLGFGHLASRHQGNCIAMATVKYSKCTRDLLTSEPLPRRGRPTSVSGSIRRTGCRRSQSISSTLGAKPTRKVAETFDA